MPLLSRLSGANTKNYKDSKQSEQNAAKTLLANVRFMDLDNPIRTIAITSAVPNEGKTFISASLAQAIATSGKRVLLVECDMRRRSLANDIGIHAQYGVYSVISGRVSLENAAVSTQTPNLYFLDAEPHIPNPSDLMNSNRFAQFIERASQLYDYVIFDTPPVGTFVDAAVLGSKVDAIFLVVRENFAKKTEVIEAADQLRKSGCNLAGAVMNCCESRGSEYYYEYYNKRGHNDVDAPAIALQQPMQEIQGTTPERAAVPQRPERTQRSSSQGRATQARATQTRQQQRTQTQRAQGRESTSAAQSSQQGIASQASQQQVPSPPQRPQSQTQQDAVRSQVQSQSAQSSSQRPQAQVSSNEQVRVRYAPQTTQAQTAVASSAQTHRTNTQSLQASGAAARSSRQIPKDFFADLDE